MYRLFGLDRSKKLLERFVAGLLNGCLGTSNSSSFTHSDLHSECVESEPAVGSGTIIDPQAWAWALLYLVPRDTPHPKGGMDFWAETSTTFVTLPVVTPPCIYGVACRTSAASSWHSLRFATAALDTSPQPCPTACFHSSAFLRARRNLGLWPLEQGQWGQARLRAFWAKQLPECFDTPSYERGSPSYERGPPSYERGPPVL